MCIGGTAGEPGASRTRFTGNRGADAFVAHPIPAEYLPARNERIPNKLEGPRTRPNSIPAPAKAMQVAIPAAQRVCKSPGSAASSSLYGFRPSRLFP